MTLSTAEQTAFEKLAQPGDFYAATYEIGITYPLVQFTIGNQTMVLNCHAAEQIAEDLTAAAGSIRAIIREAS